jgi:hypothetical protein
MGLEDRDISLGSAYIPGMAEGGLSSTESSDGRLSAYVHLRELPLPQLLLRYALLRHISAVVANALPLLPFDASGCDSAAVAAASAVWSDPASTLRAALLATPSASAAASSSRSSPVDLLRLAPQPPPPSSVNPTPDVASGSQDGALESTIGAASSAAAADAAGDCALSPPHEPSDTPLAALSPPPVSALLPALRRFLLREVGDAVFAVALEATVGASKQHRPRLTLNRFIAVSPDTPAHTLVGQLAPQLARLPPPLLRQVWRV